MGSKMSFQAYICGLTRKKMIVNTTSCEICVACHSIQGGWKLDFTIGVKALHKRYIKF